MFPSGPFIGEKSSPITVIPTLGALYQIELPVMIVVLTRLGANVPLCIGAIISAGLFGANACVVSDLGIVSARANRVTIYDQYESSLPYVLISGVISAIFYLIAGFIF